MPLQYTTSLGRGRRIIWMLKSNKMVVKYVWSLVVTLSKCLHVFLPRLCVNADTYNRSSCSADTPTGWEGLGLAAGAAGLRCWYSCCSTAICDWLLLACLFFFFCLPLIPQMAVSSWFSASSEAVSAAYLCNGPVFKGLIPPCLALFVILSPCIFLCHAPGNWSKTLTMPPHHKYPCLKDVSSLHILNTDWPVLTPEFHYELAVASELPSRLPILGCLDSLLSLCQLHQKFWDSEVTRSKRLVQPSTETVIKICLPNKPVMCDHDTMFIFLVWTRFHWGNTV